MAGPQDSSASPEPRKGPGPRAVPLAPDSVILYPGSATPRQEGLPYGCPL